MVAGATCDKEEIGEDEGSERCDSGDGRWIRREIKMSGFSLRASGIDTGSMKHIRCFRR